MLREHDRRHVDHDRRILWRQRQGALEASSCRRQGANAVLTDTEAGPCLGHAGVDRGRFGEMLYRFGIAMLRAEQITEVGVCFGEAWVAAQCLPISGLGWNKIASLLECETEIVVHGSLRPAQYDRALVFGDGDVKIAPPTIKIAETEMRFGLLRR